MGTIRTPPQPTQLKPAHRPKPTGRPSLAPLPPAASSQTPSRPRASERLLAGKRLLTLLAIIAAILVPSLAFGQDISIDFGDDATLTERAVQLVGLVTLLSLAPSILVMVTSFTRIVVVLSLLR